MSTLGSILVHNHVASVVQIEKALQRQVIRGGDLATNLIELSVVHEDDLARYAGRAFGMPVLDRFLLVNPEENAVKMMPWAKADEHRIVPIRIDGNRMIVAASSPLVENALEEVAFLLGVEFAPHLVLEFRLAMALKRCYGIAVPKRFGALLKRLSPEIDLDLPPIVPPPDKDMGLLTGIDPRRDDYLPEEPAASEIARTTMPAGASYLSTVLDSEAPPVPDEQPPIKDIRETPPPTPKVEIEKLVSQPPDVGDALRRLAAAEQRDEIIDILMEMASGIFEFAILFVIQGNEANAHSRTTGTGSVRRVGTPILRIDAGGMLETAFNTASFYLGAPGSSPADKETFEKIDRARPKNCALLPVVLRGRVILMLYGDCGTLGVKAEQMSELTRLTRLVAQAFDRILLDKKYGKYRVSTSLVPSKPAHKAFSKVPEPAETDFLTSAAAYRAKGWDESGKVRPESHLPDSSRGPAGAAPPNDRDAEGERQSSPADPSVASSWTDGTRAATDKSTIPPHEPIGLIEKKISSTPIPLVEMRTAVATDEEGAKGEGARKIKTSHIISVTTGNRSVPVSTKEDIERLIERILNTKTFDTAALAQLLDIGEDALEPLVAHFPGPLLYDRYQEAGNLRPVASYGPLLRALTHFGKKAVPHLLPLLENHDSDIRFYATFLFSELRFPETLNALTARLFDRDRQVRAIAIEVIRGFNADPEYRRAVTVVVDLLEKPSRDIETKQIAASVLGELGEPSAVGVLIRMLGSVDGKLLKNSHHALVKISFQDFGYSEKIWTIWHAENAEKTRIEWAMDGLTTANETTRYSAYQELKRLVGDSVEIPAEPKNMLVYRELQQRLRAWWKQTGKDIHPRKEGD